MASGAKIARKMSKIGTHNGTFHCDEALALNHGGSLTVWCARPLRSASRRQPFEQKAEANAETGMAHFSIMW